MFTLFFGGAGGETKTPTHTHTPLFFLTLLSTLLFYTHTRAREYTHINYNDHHRVDKEYLQHVWK